MWNISCGLIIKYIVKYCKCRFIYVIRVKVLEFPCRYSTLLLQQVKSVEAEDYPDPLVHPYRTHLNEVDTASLQIHYISVIFANQITPL